MSSHQLAYPQKRRSTRIEQTVPLVVQGVGALREPYQEQVSTLTISCHGCTYQSKHEVIQGETVYLDIKPSSGQSVGYSSKARVKWAQKVAAKDRPFQIAVELENAGNVWGIAAPPTDWFPPQLPEATEAAGSGRELKVVSRKEQQIVAVPDGGAGRITAAEKKEAPGASAAPLAQLMFGLSEQIQTMAAEAAASALISEKGRLLDEFRSQIREEAIKTIQSAVMASKDVIIRQAMKDLSEAHEAGARSNYATWMKKVQLDMESARQHVVTQESEASQRLDGMAGGAIERVKRNMETIRTETVERFVTRLREQVVPTLSEAKDSIQKLEASGTAFKRESEAISAAFDHQLENRANSSLARAHEELEKYSITIAVKTNETLVNLYQNFEKAAQESMESVLATLGSQMNSMMQEKAAEVSRQFSDGIEDYTRSYLDSISKSIAQIPHNFPVHSGQ